MIYAQTSVQAARPITGDTPLEPANGSVWSIVASVHGALEVQFGEQLLGLLATGSRFNDLAKPSSDIDLVVIVDRSERLRLNRVVQGVEVELFVASIHQIERYLDEDRASGRGAMHHMLLTGAVVSERNGIFRRLRQVAKRHWNARPPALAPATIWRLRYQPADVLRDVRDVIDVDAATAGLLIGRLVTDLLDTHYRVARRWRPKHKHLLDELEGWDPKALDLARKSVDGAIDDRLKACLALTDHVLEPLGGPMPLNWSTGWMR